MQRIDERKGKKNPPEKKSHGAFSWILLFGVDIEKGDVGPCRSTSGFQRPLCLSSLSAWWCPTFQFKPTDALTATLDYTYSENKVHTRRNELSKQIGQAKARKDEAGAQALMAEVAALKDRLPQISVPGSRLFNPGWHTAQDVRYLVQISEIIIRTALERKERRGAQWRLDFDGPDEELGKINFIVKKDEQGEVGIERREIPPMPEHLASLVEEAKAKA